MSGLSYWIQFIVIGQRFWIQMDSNMTYPRVNRSFHFINILQLKLIAKCKQTNFDHTPHLLCTFRGGRRKMKIRLTYFFAVEQFFLEDAVKYC